MRPSHLLTPFFFAILLLGSCKKDSDVAVPDALFGKVWLNTGQQDAAGAYLYQPEGTFTSPGWRDGFRFDSDGKFTLYTQGPNDAPLNVSGVWTTEDGQTFHIKQTTDAASGYNILIYSVHPSSLKARRTQ
ncbi:hypothetical protein [Hymenobacter sp.]|jgi:hypothetical protein|uniref:hypothetical protein n=1 Tax=Hymenobacter sp. TaxID=1898978 RepID=UPI002ED85426